MEGQYCEGCEYGLLVNELAVRHTTQHDTEVSGWMIHARSELCGCVALRLERRGDELQEVAVVLVVAVRHRSEQSEREQPIRPSC